MDDGFGPNIAAGSRDSGKDTNVAVLGIYTIFNGKWIQCPFHIFVFSFSELAANFKLAPKW